MFNRKSVLAACGALVLGLLVTGSSDAWPGGGSRTTYLTFNRSVALPDVVLPVGSYIFELADPTSSLHLVRVTDRNRTRIHFTGFTFPVARPAGMKDPTVTFGEAARGVPPPITAWYPLGSSLGHRFIYAR